LAQPQSPFVNSGFNIFQGIHWWYRKGIPIFAIREVNKHHP
jgi:hypothetical protein